MRTMFKDIRDVQRIAGETNAYLCTITMKIGTEPWEDVTYCARPNGGGICDDVIRAIKRGQYIGKITDYEPGEKEFKEDLRAERNDRLAASDLAVLPDRWERMTPAQRKAWADYRQALRDLPETCTDPRDPCWPTPPK